MLDHAFDSLVRYGGLSSQFSPLFWHLGDLGVSVFFVISGFIMMFTAGGDFARPGALGTFLAKRLIRIVPLYWLATLLMFAMSGGWKRGAIGFSELAMSFLFIPYRGTNSGLIQPVLGQGWTLNYEMFFYVIFALALLFKDRIGIALMAMFFIGLPAVALATNVSGVHCGTAAVFYDNPIMLLFLSGVLVGWFYRQRPDALRLGYPFLLIGAILATDVIAAAAMGSAVASPVFVTASRVLCVATVIVSVFATNVTEGAVERLSEIVGDASYSTYLFHTFVLAVMNRTVPTDGAVHGTIFVVLAVIGANLVGHLCFRLLERPLNQILRPVFVLRSARPSA
ncbi:acyltransferase [Novosphingobium sp. AAP93]|uniref:acyltransferase family protein n=1 Tax=Novosphingobium sp. AAP93 TaxID=1523427 RepID=UPI000AB4425C|nr:acyltransferase [Novosphingobium sp. AAP93]